MRYRSDLNDMSHRTSPLENEQCRQCTSFSDYLKQNRKKFEERYQDDSSKEGISQSDAMSPMREDCPLDKDQLGRKSWGLLHSMAAKFPVNPTDEQKLDMKSFFSLFSKFYPCEHCAADLRNDLKEYPPKVESQEVLSQWLCRLHNRVNKKIGKEEFDCSKVNQRWRDGWLDGSCG